MSTIKPLALALLLAACTSPVDTQESGITAPAFWKRLTGDSTQQEAALTSAADAKVEQEWWKNFHDPVLDKLVADALANNKTLGIARARVDEARAYRKSARSILFPQISGTAGASRENSGVLAGDKPYTTTQAQFEASWELDLFGKNQARAAQSTALLQSEEATAQGVRVSLLAELARNYFELRNAAQQIRITTDNIAKQQRTFDITKAQQEGALASGFDVERAGAQLAATRAQLPEWQANYDAAVNRINVLLGQAPGTLDAFLAEPQKQPNLPQNIVLATPANVLADRPDVRAAERRFAASIAGADAATRELFPTISLLSFFGAQNVGDLSAKPWGIGANLTQPILNFGRIQADIDAADAQQQQAFLDYQQTVLEALSDMETALSRYLNETSRNASLSEAAARSIKASELAKQQYKEGESGLLDLLIVERDALAAESTQAMSDALLREQLVAIYAAAGGGWQQATE